MIFSIAASFAFFVLAPLGSVSLVVGDWLFNAFLIGKVIETFVPNGPAIVGNVSAIFPVVFNIVRSTVEPVFRVNYTGMLQDAAPDVNVSEWTEQMKEYVMNATMPHAD